MTRCTRQATRQADAAADRLLSWLRQRREAVPDAAREQSETPEQPLADGSTEPSPVAAAPVAIAVTANAVTDTADEAGDGRRRPARPSDGAADVGSPLCLPHTDWLHHRLTVAGSSDQVAAFQVAASGAGVIPWQLDLDRMQEDFFHLLVVPSLPQRRRLSLAGAHTLTGQLREAVAARHGAATARVGHSRACPFDLHALVPLPADMLRLGPDHEEALAWLWAHWGTTDALRHVAVEPAPALRVPPPPGAATVRLSFWSADWTPWRALADVAARWPTLRFEIRPTYGAR